MIPEIGHHVARDSDRLEKICPGIEDVSDLVQYLIDTIAKFVGCGVGPLRHVRVLIMETFNIVKPELAGQVALEHPELLADHLIEEVA